MGHRIIGSTVIDFSPPARNLDAPYFNTFRLGPSFSKRLRPRQRVYLLARKNMQIVGSACVMEVETGTLMAMSELYGQWNHNWMNSPTPAASLRDSMKRRYGPSKINDDSIVTVITLELERSL